MQGSAEKIIEVANNKK